MTVATFDRLAFIETLKSAGVPEAQARAHVVALDDALRDSVATQADLARESASIRTELARESASIRTELARESAAIRTELAQETAAIRTELAQETAAIRTELAAVEHRLGVGLMETRAAIEATKSDTLKFVTTMIVGALGINALVVLGAMFGLAKLLGH